MTDGELRGHILKNLYDRRREGRVPATEEAARHAGIELDEIVRVTKQLAEKNLVTWYPGPIGCRTQGFAGEAEITSSGVDVIEGTEKSPFTIQIDNDMSIKVSNSNGVQIGQGNSQHTSITLGDLKNRIEEHACDGADKSHLKSIWNSLFDHPITASVLGGLASALKFD